MAQLLDSGVPDYVIRDQVNSWAFFLEARVQLHDKAGNLLADSGFPDARRLLTVSFPPKNRVLIRKNPLTGETAAGEVIETVGLPPWQVYILPGDEVIRGSVRVAGVFTETLQGPGAPGQPGPERAEAFIFEIKSGAPGEIAAPAPVSEAVTMTRALEAGEPVGVSVPLARSMYGFKLAAAAEKPGQDGPADMFFVRAPARRSDQVVEQPVASANGEKLGSIVLSGGPAYGSEILTNVARGWLIAGLAAVLVAGLAGWWASRSLTGPLVALAAATGRMAAGDLTARADLDTDDELGDLGRSFNEMAARVETTVQTLRNFVGDAAHQLHTPLTALHTYLELAGDETDPARKAGYLAAAGDQAGRLEAVVDGLLELSRLDARPPVQARFDLRDIAAEQAELYASRAEPAGLQFAYAAPNVAAPAAGDPQQVREALASLLDNAFKFTPPGGEVRLGLSVEGDRAVLAVTDTGIGLLPEDLPRLFGRFYRGRNAAAYPGSGLGLAIARSIAEAHGGAVAAESMAQGARFTLALPLDRSPDPPND
jgi:signal transduction histidine kinase